MRKVRCNFCNSDNAKFLYKGKDRMIRKKSDKEFPIYQCLICGLAYLNPQPEWRELEYFYGGDYYTNVSADVKRNIFYRTLRKIKRAVFGAPNPKFWNFGKSEGKFLDVGCGSGAYESYIMKNYPGWEFYGVEPSAASYHLANKIKGFRVFNGDLKSANYGNNFFDVILMSHSLEHMSDPMRILEECFRILKPGGRLIAAVPNFDCPARKLFGRYWVHLDAPRHLFHFSENMLKEMLKKSGFRIKSVNFEVLSGSITKSAAYIFNLDGFFFDTPFMSLIVHYLIFPINKFIELIRLASGLRVITIK